MKCSLLTAGHDRYVVVKTDLYCSHAALW